MEKYNLLVLDDHEGYANRLKTAMEQKQGGEAVSVFWAGDADMLNEIRSNYDVHAAIISEGWTRAGGRFAPGEAITVALYETRGKAASDDPAIYRNEPIEKAATYILSLLENHMRVVGITGVGGGCGKTTIAMALAHQFVRDGKRVFFLSLESYMARSPFSGTAAVGLAEVLVALDVAEDLGKTIRNACYQPQRYKGVDAFAISEYNVDRSEITADDVGRLLGAMKRLNLWDVVIVDLDSRMDDRLFEVWQQAARMVLVVPSTRIGAEKLGYVERELTMRERRGEAELRKLVPVLNFYDGALAGIRLFNRDIQLAIKPLSAKSAKFTSAQWCDALSQNSGLELFRSLFEEVTL